MITANELKKSMGYLKLTEDELAEMAGYSRTYINNLVNERRPINQQCALVLINALDRAVTLRLKEVSKAGHLINRVINCIKFDANEPKNDLSSGGYGVN